jgi:hypothetical protein
MPKVIMPSSEENASQTSLAMLDPFLRALDPEGLAVPLPNGAERTCRWIETIRTMVCATPLLSPPLLRTAIVTAAWRDQVDGIAIRHGAHPETLDAVEVDAVIGRHGPARFFWNTIAARTADGGYWLVPPAGQVSPCLRLDAVGITPMAQPPYADPDERVECVARAARETVLALRRLRRL